MQTAKFFSVKLDVNKTTLKNYENSTLKKKEKKNPCLCMKTALQM